MGEPKRYALLKFVPPPEPVYVVVECYAERDADEVDDYAHMQYLYGEHNCPTNITSSIVEVIVGKDPDCHELFEYVDSFAYDGGASTDPMRRFATTHDFLRYMREAAPELYRDHFAGALSDDAEVGYE